MIKLIYLDDPMARSVLNMLSNSTKIDFGIDFIEHSFLRPSPIDVIKIQQLKKLSEIYLLTPNEIFLLQLDFARPPIGR